MAYRPLCLGLFALLSLGGCDEAGGGDAGVADAQPDAAAADAGPMARDRPSASFLIDEEATPKELWPEHPLVACLLEIAGTQSAMALQAEIRLSPDAAGALISFRGETIDSLDQLDAIPFVGPLAFERLLAAAREIPGCACETDACGLDPRPAQREELMGLIGDLQDQQGNALDLDVDMDTLSARVDAILDRGAGTPTAFLVALRTIMLAYPNGHAGIYDTTPPTSFPFVYQSRWGVCARPHARGFVITFADEDNRLGLRPGDLVTHLDGREGDGLVTWLLTQPALSPIPASPSARAHLAGLMLFASLRTGATLTVEGVDGVSRDRFVDEPATDAGAVWCADPFARDISQDAYPTLREDGVAVIRLPNLVPAGVPQPTDPSGILPYIQELLDRLAAAFATVREEARGIVWDLRANAGGISAVGFAIVQGFMSSRAGDLSVCEAREPRTDTFVPGGGDYEIGTDGVVRFDGLSFDVGEAFTSEVPTAVLVDGLSVSAADYFALATRRFTNAWLVGAPTFGGYGSANLGLRVGEFDVFSDRLRCVDADGVLLEGYGVEVDLAVDYDPRDLATGRDTVLEAAVDRILSCGANDCAP